MEGFIIALIVMAVGALLGQQKKEAPAKNPAPQTGSKRQQNYKRVEDYAKEIYGELQNQMKDQPERTRQVKQAARTVEKAVKAAPVRQARQEIADQEITGRLSAHQSRPAIRNSQASADDTLFPLDKNDLKKSIILAEILLPPKSKR